MINKDNQNKVITAFFILFMSVVLLLLFRFMKIERDLNLDHEYGRASHISYAFHFKIILWQLVPFLLMCIDLIFQQRALKKEYKKTIVTEPVVVVAIMCVAIYFLIDFSSSDGLGMFASYLAMPIIQIISYVVYKVATLVRK